MGRCYYTITEITDYGPYVTKLVLPMPISVNVKSVKPECFSVYVERKDKKGDILMLPKNWSDQSDKEMSKGYILVKDAYPSSQDGERREEGEFVTLEMKYGPQYPLSAAMAFLGNFNEFIVSDYRITQIEKISADSETLTGMVFDFCAGNTMKQTEKFLHGVSSYQDEPLKYGYFNPQTGNDKRPLIIWLHGAGEGGQDPTIAYAANKVVNLASDEIQTKFEGAFLLVPQTPTFWMDDGSGEYGRTGKSKYVIALKALIDEFIAQNDAAIDTNRIYIGGCSNGGFMTMRMVIDYPDFFAAAFPVCEALYDDVISDADIKSISHLPIWFTHSKDDDVIKPEETSTATYKRLLNSGAKNVHYSLFDHVVDIRGVFTEENREPYKYMGHLSWIYTLNDDCRLDYNGEPVVVDGREVSLMDWLALQRK